MDLPDGTLTVVVATVVAVVVVVVVVVVAVIVVVVVVVVFIVPIHNYKNIYVNNMEGCREQRWNRSDFKTTGIGLSRSKLTGRSTASTSK